MGKLIFTYGVMGSAKTAMALMQYFEFCSQNKKVLLLKPSIDTRNGYEIIKSRIGLYQKAQVFTPQTNLEDIITDDLYAVIIDEGQFCETHHIDELKNIAVKSDIFIYVYGLKTNFQSHLFEGSKRLIEIADELRKLEISCVSCNKPAEITARYNENGDIVYNGDIIFMGGNDKYKPMCYSCWVKNKK